LGNAREAEAEVAPVAGPEAAPGLAATPGPLPFDVTVRQQVTRERGAVATALVAFFAVLFFFAAAAGGFALSRYVGGKSIMPPTSTSSAPITVPAEDDAPTLKVRTGNAASTTPAQGGGFQLPVPSNWVEFTEEVSGEHLPSSTRFYYVSPNGAELLTVERIVGFYPGHTIEEYVKYLRDSAPAVLVQSPETGEIPGLPENGQKPPEMAQELHYRTITSAKELAPGDQNAQDLNRSTFAHLLPYAGDLWVVSMTVPIEQEDSGNELFDRIAKDFQVTG
jgi:hypothetical protein